MVYPVLLALNTLWIWRTNIYIYYWRRRFEIYSNSFTRKLRYLNSLVSLTAWERKLGISIYLSVLLLQYSFREQNEVVFKLPYFFCHLSDITLRSRVAANGIAGVDICDSTFNSEETFNQFFPLSITLLKGGEFILIF